MIKKKSEFLFLNEENREIINALDKHSLPFYSSYEGMPFCNRDLKESLFKKEITTGPDNQRLWLALLEGNKIKGLCGIRLLDWDSQHFGIAMGKLSISASPNITQKETSELINRIINTAVKKYNIKHISAELDVRDRKCINALLLKGFKIMDEKCYFFANSIPVKKPKFTSFVVDYDLQHHKRIMEILEKTEFASRFASDQHISLTKSREMYKIWASSALKKCDTQAFVFLRSGKIEGCGFSELKTIQTDNLGNSISLPDGGLYFSSTQGCGGYLPLSYKNLETSITRHGMIRTAVSSRNTAAIRVLKYLGAQNGSRFISLRLWTPNLYRKQPGEDF